MIQWYCEPLYVVLWRVHGELEETINIVYDRIQEIGTVDLNTPKEIEWKAGSFQKKMSEPVYIYVLLEI